MVAGLSQRVSEEATTWGTFKIQKLPLCRAGNTTAGEEYFGAIGITTTFAYSFISDFLQSVAKLSDAEGMLIRQDHKNKYKSMNLWMYNWWGPCLLTLYRKYLVVSGAMEKPSHPSILSILSEPSNPQAGCLLQFSSFIAAVWVKTPCRATSLVSHSISTLLVYKMYDIIHSNWDDIGRCLQSKLGGVNFMHNIRCLHLLICSNQDQVLVHASVELNREFIFLLSKWK